jgi:hypothetical protein
LLKRYDKNAGVGAVVAMMLPYAVVVSVVWILLFLAWELLGLPTDRDEVASLWIGRNRVRADRDLMLHNDCNDA